MAHIVEVEVDKRNIRVAVYSARCSTGRCFILAYVYRDKPRLAIVPAQPSPLCMRLSDRNESKIVREALAKAYPISLGYAPTACLIPRSLLRDTIGGTLETLMSLGVIEEVENT